jgi:hypothetical protein
MGQRGAKPRRCSALRTCQRSRATRKASGLSTELSGRRKPVELSNAFQLPVARAQQTRAGRGGERRRFWTGWGPPLGGPIEANRSPHPDHDAAHAAIALLGDAHPLHVGHAGQPFAQARWPPAGAPPPPPRPRAPAGRAHPRCWPRCALLANEALDHSRKQLRTRRQLNG